MKTPTFIKMTTKNLDTLIPDIYALFDVEHSVDEENLKTFADNVAAAVKGRLETVQSWDRPTLRVSKLGTPDRKLWYELHDQNEPLENDSFKLSPENVMKFMYGDIIEELVLLLVKESGHTVEGEQGEVEIEGVIGHRDCIIDGITVDVKSTSKFAFQKFEKGTLHQDDPFGYIAQISSYCFADESPYGAFLAMNKETGQLALLKVHKIDMIHPPTRIKEVRQFLEKDEPPEAKCYEPVPMGKKGNMELARGCGWCPFKEKCWENANGGVGLRKFQYSNGVKYLTEVVDEPRVEELT